VGVFGPPSNPRFLGPSRVHVPKNIWIGLAVFANRQWRGVYILQPVVQPVGGICKWAQPNGAWTGLSGRLWRHCVTARRLCAVDSIRYGAFDRMNIQNVSCSRLHNRLYNRLQSVYTYALTHKPRYIYSSRPHLMLWIAMGTNNRERCDGQGCRIGL